MENKRKGKFMRQRYAFALRIIKNLPKDRKYNLIDIGALGKFLKYFLPKNVTYYSLDYKGKHDYIFDLDKGKMPIKDKVFDIVVCIETLEHLLYPEKVMKEILRIGKKDAIFLLSMPNDYNFILRFYYLVGKKTAIQKPFKTVIEHMHIHTPRVKDILEFFSEYLEIKKVDFFWESRTGHHNPTIIGKGARVIDMFISFLAAIYPSLFSRGVVILGENK